MDESSRVSLARSLCHSDTGRGQDNFIQSISNFFALQEGEKGKGGIDRLCSVQCAETTHVI